MSSINVRAYSWPVVVVLALLSVIPSGAFVPPMRATRVSNPVLRPTTGIRVGGIGELSVPDVRLGVSSHRPLEETEAQALVTPPVGPPSATASSQPAEQPDLVYGETAARSVVKALVWRVTAAVVTLISGLVFSRNLATAMSIVGSDFVTKSGFMFLGERLWNKVQWGQGQKGDSAQRSLAKAVLWRLFAASNTLICGIFLARDLSVASKIAGTDTFFKTALFFVNERIWSTIKWGKKYEPEYFI